MKPFTSCLRLVHEVDRVRRSDHSEAKWTGKANELLRGWGGVVAGLSFAKSSLHLWCLISIYDTHILPHSGCHGTVTSNVPEGELEDLYRGVTRMWKLNRDSISR